MTKPPKTSAQAVSHALHQAGFHTTSDYNHWGLRVRRPNHAGEARVSAYFPSDSQCVRVIAEAAEILLGLGYTVRQKEHTLYVSKQAGA